MDEMARIMCLLMLCAPLLWTTLATTHISHLQCAASGTPVLVTCPVDTVVVGSVSVVYRLASRGLTLYLTNYCQPTDHDCVLSDDSNEEIQKELQQCLGKTHVCSLVLNTWAGALVNDSRCRQMFRHDWGKYYPVYLVGNFSCHSPKVPTTGTPSPTTTTLRTLFRKSEMPVNAQAVIQGNANSQEVRTTLKMAARLKMATRAGIFVFLVAVLAVLIILRKYCSLACNTNDEQRQNNLLLNDAASSAT